MYDSAPSVETMPVAAVQILWRSWPGGLRTGYAPKGPFVCSGGDNRRIFSASIIPSLLHQFGDVRTPQLRIEPPITDSHRLSLSFGRSGARRAIHHIQPQHTVLVDLQPPEDEILRRMESKTRYNIRLAQRRGVIIREGTGDSDVDTFLNLHEETVERDAYHAHGRDYLRRFLTRFGNAATLYLASVAGEDVAGIVVVIHGGDAIYLYGASGNRHRQHMPNYLLQWEAMRRAKHAGCKTYDMWGTSPPGAVDDAKFGLYRFKHGFGQYRVWTGCWDIPTAFWYPLYRLAEKTRRDGLLTTIRGTSV